MTVPVTPTTRAHRFTGSTGSPEIFPLLLGTTPDVSQGTLGALESLVVHTPVGQVGGPRVNRRCIEAFGKTFALQGPNIYERVGQTTAWTINHSPNVAGQVPTGSDTGFHLLHPGGRPLLAMLWRDRLLVTSPVIATYTYDGVNWVDVAITADINSTGYGDSISYRDSIFWLSGDTTSAPDNTVIEYNFLTSIFDGTLVNGNIVRTTERSAAFIVHHNNLYIAGLISTGLNGLMRFSGGAWVDDVTGITAWNHNRRGDSGDAAFVDGDHVIAFYGHCGKSGVGSGAGVSRMLPVAAGGSQMTDISAVVLSGTGLSYIANSYSDARTWEVIVDNNTNPGIPPAIHLWLMTGPGQAGTRIAYTWHYRAITHDGVEIFTLGETIQGGTSGATGVVAETSSGKVHVSYVSGVFQSGEVLTGLTSSDSATSTSVLTEQALAIKGTSVTGEFSLPMVLDSIGPHLLAFPDARVELGITGIQLLHGGASGTGFTLGETLTGAGGATGVLFVDNLIDVIVYPTNGTAFINGEVITGGSSGETATLSAGPVSDAAIPSTEVVGGTKHYFRVWGDPPNVLGTTTLYSGSKEQAPWKPEVVLGVTLEVGSAPALAPTISNGEILNLPADNGGRVWSLIHDADAGAFSAGDVYELALNGV